jgi:hypothetical protein
MGETADGIGDILTGGIFARTLDRMRGSGAAGHGEHDGAGGTCLNCGTVRVGAFCHACGQGGHVHRSMASLGHDIAHGVFHFEGRIWKTLPMLALHPGQLTRRYVHGERAKFVSPMALFLFSVFLLFAAVNRVTMADMTGVSQGLAKAKSQISDQIDKAQHKLGDLNDSKADRIGDHPKASTADLDKQIADMTGKIAALEAAERHLPVNARDAAHAGPIKAGDATYNFDVADGVKAMNINTGSKSLDGMLGHVKENPALYAYKLESAASKFSWALIPISMPFIWLLFFWRRDVGMYDHAIFAFHSLSFMTLLVVGLIGLDLIGVGQAWLWLAFFLAPLIHMYKHLKGAYLIGRFGAAWRTAALLVMTGIASLLFFVLLMWLEAS